MTGRYIRLQKRRPEMMGVKPESSQHKFLSLCQLQLWVCKMGTYGASGQSCKNCSTICQYTCNNYYGCDNRTLHDVGINKAVEVSSLQWGDGSYINDMFQTPHDSSHCVKTRDTGRPTLHWVRIDLGTTYMVYNLEVQARVDCCSEHELRKFYVSVADEKLQTMLFPPKTDHVCLYNVDAVPIRYTANLICDIPKAGRFVALIKNDAIGLSLCEVRIFGHPYITLELTEECTPEYREAVCGPGLLCERGRCRGKVKHHCLKQEDCVSTTACDSGWCKNKLRIKCTATDECQGGMVCDKVFGECTTVHSYRRMCNFKVYFPNKCLGGKDSDVFGTDRSMAMERVASVMEIIQKTGFLMQRIPN
ncbi:uncharacterized protein LOC143278039 [Babylonia areolata]|uniref:uncharacterized protein LOC143278039 n=1 Tax=Babylonia areolata TaxID=304850 RepID=UPI003FD08810